SISSSATCLIIRPSKWCELSCNILSEPSRQIQPRSAAYSSLSGYSRRPTDLAGRVPRCLGIFERHRPLAAGQVPAALAVVTLTGLRDVNSFCLGVGGSLRGRLLGGNNVRHPGQAKEREERQNESAQHGVIILPHARGTNFFEYCPQVGAS